MKDDSTIMTVNPPSVSSPKVNSPKITNNKSILDSVLDFAGLGGSDYSA